MLKVIDLYKKFYLGKVEVPVIKGISLEIESGEYVLITGRSGAGKSTLLYLLSLLDSPTSGDIYINGQLVAGLGEKQKGLIRLEQFGYVFQDYALLPELSAWENVALPLLMQGRDKKEVKSRVAEVLEQVDLADRTENLPSQLSGGQQQRVSIARAISTYPKVLFADEPTANLDSKTAETIMKVFRDLNEQGQTIVMVTHETKKALGAKRIIHLSDGVIEQESIL